MSATPKVVFDTQIYLRAIVNGQSACGRLTFHWQPHYQLHYSNAIKHEVLDVLNRPRIRSKFPQISDEQINKISAILDLANIVEVKPEDIEPICRDPKDDVFLACAKVAGADYLVSEDKDLLVLERHHNTAIVGVAAFLSVLEGRQTPPEA